MRLQLETRLMCRVMGFKVVPGWEGHIGSGDRVEGADEPTRPLRPKRRFGS